MKRKSPATAFCVAFADELCSCCTFTQPECPHKALHVPDNDSLCTPAFWNAFLCPPFPHALDRSALQSILSHAAQSATVTRPLPSTEPLPHHGSAGFVPKASSSMWNTKQLLLGMRKMLLVEDLPCLPLQLSRGPAIPSRAWQQTLGTALRKAEWARGEHRGGFGKINAMGAFTELSSPSVFQWH